MIKMEDVSMSYLSVGLVISLLKKYNIKKLVLSSGSRNIPFVSAVENDEFFQCYSVVDERNAAFFALGLSQESGEPVGLACTSGTAVSNYLSGITEAYYSKIPLVAITFDRNPYNFDQLETQKIDQISIFKSVCKKIVDLPVIKDEEDVWYCQRLINEAFIAMTAHGSGPVQINIPLTGGQNELVDGAIFFSKMEKVVKIEYINEANKAMWEIMAQRLQSFKKVLIIMGQHSKISEELRLALNKFSKFYKFPILTDNLSNYRCEYVVFAENTIKALNKKTLNDYAPELIITFGCNFQERIKDLFRNASGMQHWLVDDSGKIKDVFRRQTALFECQSEVFFDNMVKMKKNANLEADYFDKWKTLEEKLILPPMQYNNFYVVDKFLKCIPPNSILHLSILNNTRLAQFFRIDDTIKVYSNVNSFGIDGCLPTFLGQAFETKELAFLLIGDLSFFYGMNALAIKHKKNNIRILLINNGGGAEFHIMPESDRIPTIDLHIGAEHECKAKGWAESQGYEYISAMNEEELCSGLDKFVTKDSTNPVLFEVFTDMKEDGRHTLSVYRHLEKKLAE